MWKVETKRNHPKASTEDSAHINIRSHGASLANPVTIGSQNVVKSIWIFRTQHWFSNLSKPLYNILWEHWNSVTRRQLSMWFNKKLKTTNEWIKIFWNPTFSLVIQTAMVSYNPEFLWLNVKLILIFQYKKYQTHVIHFYLSVNHL